MLVNLCDLGSEVRGNTLYGTTHARSVEDAPLAEHLGVCGAWYNRLASQTSLSDTIRQQTNSKTRHQGWVCGDALVQAKHGDAAVVAVRIDELRLERNVFIVRIGRDTIKRYDQRPWHSLYPRRLKGLEPVVTNLAISSGDESTTSDDESE